MRRASPYMAGPPGRPEYNPLQSGLHFARPDALSPGLTRISAIILSFLGMALIWGGFWWLLALVWLAVVLASMYSQDGAPERQAVN